MLPRLLMKVLARIPALSDSDQGVVAPMAGPEAEAMTATETGTFARADAHRRPRSRFPTVSIVLLAVRAAAVWSLASWTESLRMERHRLERMAAARDFMAQKGTVSR